MQACMRSFQMGTQDELTEGPSTNLRHKINKVVKLNSCKINSHKTCYMIHFFKLQTFQKNIERVKELVTGMVEGGRFINSCFQWENPMRSLVAFLVSLCFKILCGKILYYNSIQIYTAMRGSGQNYGPEVTVISLFSPKQNSAIAATEGPQF